MFFGMTALRQWWGESTLFPVGTWLCPGQAVHTPQDCSTCSIAQRGPCSSSVHLLLCGFLAASALSWPSRWVERPARISNTFAVASQWDEKAFTFPFACDGAALERNNLVYWKAFLPTAGPWNWMIFMALPTQAILWFCGGKQWMWPVHCGNGSVMVCRGELRGGKLLCKESVLI